MKISSKEITKMSTKALEDFISLLPFTEGSVKNYHTDSQGYRTAPYGVLADPKVKGAYKKNKEVAASLGYDIDNLTAEESKEVAVELAKEMEQELIDKIPEYSELEPKYQVFLLDAKYNTGSNYKTFAKNALEYQTTGSEDSFVKMIENTSRLEGGKRTEGMDNRSAKVLMATGIETSLERLKELKLDKASSKSVVPEEYQVSAQEAIEDSPQETTYRVQSGDTLGEIYDRLAIPNMSRYEFYERMFANNPEAFGRTYDAKTLKSGAVLSLGSILPESDYGDFSEAPPLEYSVSEDIDYESLDEDSDLFSPEMEIF